MFTSPIIDVLFLCALLFIWLTLFYHAILAVKGYNYYKFITAQGEKLMSKIENLPAVSVLVPAKNEGSVLSATINALLELDYPKDKIELVIINDGSTDGTKEILDDYASKFLRVKPVHIPPTGEFHGKAAALNEGLKHCRFDYIAVFDADNLPESVSLQYLIRAIINNNEYAAVCGKIRTFNRNKNLLTRFANIEFIAYQWLMQAGTWRMRKIAILPGTNFVIRKEALLKAGAWDIKALTEDTELSFRLFSLGYVIEFFPLAVSWEQEPEEWRAWRRQRLRWVQGNKYIVQSYLHEKKMRQANLLNVLYMFLIYYVLLFSIVFSDIIFICGLTNLVRLSFAGPLIALWGFAFVIFVLEIAIALTCEVGEDNWSNFGLAALMYFTYCQQWLYVALKSYISIKKREDGVFWTKTQRF